jgi:hypothetical protein
MHDAPLAIAAILGICAGVVPVVIGLTLQHFKVTKAAVDAATSANEQSNSAPQR